LIATALSLLFVTMGAIGGGLLGFSFTSNIASDTVIAQATLPYGTPRRQSIAVQQKLVEAADTVPHEKGMISPGIFSLIGTRLEEGEVEVETLVGPHYVSVLVALSPADECILSGRVFASPGGIPLENRTNWRPLALLGRRTSPGGNPFVWSCFTRTRRSPALRHSHWVNGCAPSPD
jgi:hypothetical protein